MLCVQAFVNFVSVVVRQLSERINAEGRTARAFITQHTKPLHAPASLVGLRRALLRQREVTIPAQLALELVFGSVLQNLALRVIVVCTPTLHLKARSICEEKEER